MTIFGLNYTPHEIRVRPATGEDIVFPPTGTVARVAVTTTPCHPDLAHGLPTEVRAHVVHSTYGEATLPGPLGDTYIVSTMFADAFRRQHGDGRDATGRATQLYVPDSGPSAIRENGQIVAVRALIQR